MHPRLIFAIARKDALDILLNKATLGVLISPLLIAVLFSGLDTLFGSKTINVLIYNPQKSGVEQILKNAYPNLKITYANSPDTVSTSFGASGTHKSVFDLGLVIPVDFESTLRSGGHPQVQLFLNEDTISDQQRGLLQAAIANYSRNVVSPEPPAHIDVVVINPPRVIDNGIHDIRLVYSTMALLMSFLAGTSLVPGMLVEEKEKKTLRMLMVTPASFEDIVLGKLLVGFIYQVVLSLAVVGIQAGFTGQVPLVLLFILLGSCFSVSLGLLFGSWFQTTSSVGMYSGIASLFYIAPIFFVGLLGQLIGDTPFTPIVKLLPTFYLTEGITNALQNSAVWSNTWIDIVVVFGSIMLLVVLATWGIRRQASTVATI